jgi:hypothetical protein
MRKEALAAIMVVVVALAFAAGFGAATFAHNTTTQTTSSAGKTITLTTTLTTTASPITVATSAGGWKFRVLLNATTISRGQAIGYSCYLTNTSNHTQTIIVVTPLSNPTVYTQGDQQVWMLDGSEMNSAQSISAGQTLNCHATIPTSELQAGQTYILSSSPGVLTDTNPETFFGQQLQVNATITVG